VTGKNNRLTKRRSERNADEPADAVEALPPLAMVKGFLADKQQSEMHRLINERVRLGILSALAVSPSMTFTELKALLDVTDGNLSVHARKLEDAGLVECSKRFEGRVPKTEYRISAVGREALQRFLKHMEALIEATGR